MQVPRRVYRQNGELRRARIGGATFPRAGPVRLTAPSSLPRLRSKDPSASCETQAPLSTNTPAAATRLASSRVTSRTSTSVADRSVPSAAPGQRAERRRVQSVQVPCHARSSDPPSGRREPMPARERKRLRRSPRGVSEPGMSSLSSMGETPFGVCRKRPDPPLADVRPTDEHSSQWDGHSCPSWRAQLSASR